MASGERLDIRASSAQCNSDAAAMTEQEGFAEAWPLVKDAALDLLSEGIKTKWGADRVVSAPLRFKV